MRTLLILCLLALAGCAMTDEEYARRLSGWADYQPRPIERTMLTCTRTSLNTFNCH